MIAEKPLGCRGCPAEHFGIGFVPPTTPHWARFVVVGQGPGEQEALFSEPFYPEAPSGKMLRGWLADSGINEFETAFGNVVCCWLPKIKLGGDLGKESRPPTTGELQHCWNAHVGPWLYDLPENAPIIAVGAPAARWLLGLPTDEPTEHLCGVTQLTLLPALETNA